MSIAVIDLAIKQGATFRLGLNYKNRLKKPYDLTGFKAHAQIRDAAGVLIHDLSTENGGIVLNGTVGAPALGGIDLYISDEATAAMGFTVAAYDFFLLYPNGDTDCLFKGKVTFEKAQTING